MMTAASWFRPDWPLPSGVEALVTTRDGGQSLSPYEGNNLATHVGDEPERVAANRTQLSLMLPSEPVWLQQVHGVEVLELERIDPDRSPDSIPVADAVITGLPRRVCAVLTADCLPLLFCAKDGSQVAAAHAGWRGLAAGVISATLSRFECAPSALSVYLGPAISQAHFEVGDDVLRAFKVAAGNRPFATPVQSAFEPLEPGAGTGSSKAGGGPDKYLADLYQLARAELLGAGVQEVYGGNHCTYREQDAFYSFRREGVTGRFASLIWRSVD